MSEEPGMNWDGGGGVRVGVAMLVHAGAATMRSSVQMRTRATCGSLRVLIRPAKLGRNYLKPFFPSPVVTFSH